MNQVLIISSDPEFCSVVEEQCLRNNDNLFVFFEGLDDLLPVIDLVSDVALLIIDGDRLEDKEKVFELVRRRRESFRRCVLFSMDRVAQSGFELVNDFHTLASIVCPEHQEESRTFVSIPMECLTHFAVLPFPLFLGLSTDNFVKRIPAFETIDHSVLSAYKGRGINEFFFERLYVRDFSALLLNNMLNRLDRDYLDFDDRDIVSSEVFSTVRELVSTLGLKARVVELCERLIAQLLKNISVFHDSEPALYLDKLRTRKDLNFNYRLAELTGYLAGQILEKTQGQGNLRDMIIAAFFCDMSLQNPNHVHVREYSEFELLADSEKNEVIDHAAVAAEIIGRAFSETSAGLIIRQHHGDLDGFEFPARVSDLIDERAKCFIAAHELAYAILAKPEESIWSICQGLSERYRGTVVEEYLLAFEVRFLKTPAVA